MTNYETAALAMSPLDEARIEIAALRHQLEDERRAHAMTRATLKSEAEAYRILLDNIKPLLAKVANGELVPAEVK